MRQQNAIRRQLGAAVKQASDRPNDPMALMALAEATVAQFEALKKGDLDRALAASRRAAKISADCFEAVYWEARSQECAGRREKAAARYADFIELGKTRVRCKNLVRDAEKRLRRLTASLRP